MRVGPRTGAVIAVAVVVAIASLGVWFVAPAGADAEDDLRAAQRRANQAAEELSAAQTQLAQAGAAVADAQQRVSRLDARVAEVRQRVRDLAVRLYVEGTAPLSRLLRLADAKDIVPAQQYSHAIAAGSGDALRQYRSDKEDLVAEQEALARKQGQQRTAVADLDARRTAATKEVDRLARVVETARAAQAAQVAQEAQRRAQAAAGDAVRSSSAASAGAPASGAAGPRPTTAAVPSPAPPVAADADWICPVQGPHAFSNDYGAARWGGGTHMGNDILAPRGTPVVASVSGVVTQRTGAVSGNAYFLRGDDGAEYFGAHLDSFGASGRVSAGAVIGAVGNTGDAAGGPPHLHFEIHPAGGGYINPYPTLRKYC